MIIHRKMGVTITRGVKKKGKFFRFLGLSFYKGTEKIPRTHVHPYNDGRFGCAVVLLVLLAFPMCFVLSKQTKHSNSISMCERKRVRREDCEYSKTPWILTSSDVFDLLIFSGQRNLAAD